MYFIKETKAATTPPAAAAKQVVTKVREVNSGSADNTEPPLKPNQPNQSIRTPAVAKGMLCPGIACGLPSLNLQSLPANMGVANEEDVEQVDSLTGQKKSGGILDLIMSIAVPGYGFLKNIGKGGLEGIRGLNQRLQQSDFGQSDNFAEFLKRRRDKEALARDPNVFRDARNITSNLRRTAADNVIDRGRGESNIASRAPKGPTGARRGIDSRKLYCFSSLLGCSGLLLFSFFASNALNASICWSLVGAGLAGTYMPGLQILNSRLNKISREKYVAVYTSFFGLGVAFSFSLFGILKSFNLSIRNKMKKFNCLS